MINFKFSLATFFIFSFPAVIAALVKDGYIHNILFSVECTSVLKIGVYINHEKMIKQ